MYIFNVAPLLAIEALGPVIDGFSFVGTPRRGEEWGGGVCNPALTSSLSHGRTGVAELWRQLPLIVDRVEPGGIGLH
jgi:hypothetical protein